MVDVKVVDQRKIKAVFTAGAFVYAKVNPDKPIEDTVKRYIDDGLAARGFSTGEAPNAVHVNVAITKLFWDQVVFATYELADYNTDVTVTNNLGVVIYQRSFAQEKKLPYAPFFTNGGMTDDLDEVIAKGTKTMFDDKNFIAALLSNTVSAPQ